MPGPGSGQSLYSPKRSGGKRVSPRRLSPRTPTTIARPSPGAPARRMPTRETPKVQGALRRVRKAYASTGRVSGLDAEQNKVLRTVLRQGEKAGATPRQKLSAVETGLVESNLRNLNYGDADSKGWRQERTSQYGDGPKGATNVKASAKRFFEELKTEGAGAATPGLAAQGAQGSAFPDRYDEMEPQARRILSEASKPAKKPKPKDKKVLRKAGISPKAVKAEGKTSDPNASKKPFKKAASTQLRRPEKIVNPKWDPDDDGHGQTFLAKGISRPVRKWSKKYDVTVGEAKADSGHVSPGHLQQGTATDLYPQEDTEAGWDRLEKGLKVLEAQGFEIGYGTNGVGQAWSNHGRNNHAHVEWVGQGSDPDAIKKLGGLTNAQISKIESSAYGGGSSTSGGGSASGGGSTSGEMGGKTGMAPKKGATKKQRLQRVRDAYTEDAEAPTTSESWESIRRRYNAVV